MHPVLTRQLARLNLDQATHPDATAWRNFLTVVAAAYHGHDEDRYLLERSLTLSSKEMGDLHAALRRDRERLAAVIDSLDRGLIVLNRDLLVEIVNPEAARILGTSATELQTWSIHDLKRCASEDAALTAMFDDIAAGTAGDQTGRGGGEDGRLRTADGHTLAVSASAIPIEHDDLIHGVVVVLTDISERQRLEMELRQSQKLEAVGRLAAGVAHEINTPMQFVGDNLVFIENSVSAMTSVLHAVQDLVKSGTLPEERARFLMEVLDACDPEYLAVELPQALAQSRDGIDRVTSIVGAMKSFSHLGSTTVTLADLNQALRDTVTVARGELRGIAEVTFVLGDIPPVPCMIHDLKQAFLNFVINASHAIADHARTRPGHVVVASHRHDEHVVITISDNGGGIPPQVAEHIFEPFFTTKEVGRGSGQGLALAHRAIVDGHHGKLSFTTEVGTGTTFEIQLPIHGAAVTES
jgi:two-component system, NtrC family, sensor kinase